jgi:predicted transposase YbfD/YdcC
VSLVLLPHPLPLALQTPETSSTICSSDALSTPVLAIIQCCKKEINRKISARGEETILLLKIKSFLFNHNVQQTFPNRNHKTPPLWSLYTKGSSSDALSAPVLVIIQCCKKEINRKISAWGEETILLLKIKSFLFGHNVQQTFPNRNHKAPPLWSL